MVAISGTHNTEVDRDKLIKFCLGICEWMAEKPWFYGFFPLSDSFNETDMYYLKFLLIFVSTNSFVKYSHGLHIYNLRGVMGLSIQLR